MCTTTMYENQEQQIQHLTVSSLFCSSLSSSLIKVSQPISLFSASSANAAYRSGKLARWTAAVAAASSSSLSICTMAADWSCLTATLWSAMTTAVDCHAGKFVLFSIHHLSSSTYLESGYRGGRPRYTTSPSHVWSYTLHEERSRAP